MKKNYFCLLFFSITTFLTAQEYFEMLPENPDPNKCFAKCVVPDEYGEEQVTIMTKPEFKRLEIIPAEYENQPQEIVVRPASKRFVYVPAVYETVVDTLWIKDPHHKLEDIPQKTQTIQRRILVKDETTKETVVPAEYTQVIKKILVKKGGMTAWREVPCNIPERGTILPIHYALGSAALTAEAKRIIDKHIYSLMQEDRSSTVEIGSHTDSRGGDAFNQNLSEQRAKSVVEYLISKGISKERLIAVGYGETRLLNNCSNGIDCSEKDYAINRRTEFKVF